MKRFIVITIFLSFTTIISANEYIFSDKEAVQYDLKKYLQQLHPDQYPLIKTVGLKTIPTYLAQREELIGEPVVETIEPSRSMMAAAGCQGLAAASCSGSARRIGCSGRARGLFRGRLFSGRLWGRGVFGRARRY